jgi:hypothetical protein
MRQQIPLPASDRWAVVFNAGQFQAPAPFRLSVLPQVQKLTLEWHFEYQWRSNYDYDIGK